MLKSNKKSAEKTRELSLNAVAQVLSALNSPDALKIFMSSENGISSSTRTIKELGLTQKRYYVWLKRLIAAGLIEKRDGVYQHTLLGQVCQRLGTALQGTLIQGERLKLAEKLLTSNILSPTEQHNILRSISGNGLYGTIDITDILSNVRTIVNYDVFIEEVVKMIDDTKESAYLATNKVDLRVSNSTFRIIDRGVKLYFLSVEMGFSENIELLRMIMNPSSMGLIRRLLTSRELNIKVIKNLAYCFIVTDDENGILELPHPISQEFYVAFRFKNTYLCKKLIEVFNSLYETAKEDPRIAFTKKSLGLYKDLTGKIQEIYKDKA